MKVKIIEGCIGCGLCVSTCPSVFCIGQDGLAEVCAPPVGAGEDDAVRQAAENCPVGVIKTQD